MIQHILQLWDGVRFRVFITVDMNSWFILSPAPSFTSHRFVTVRRGSPAARSGQIQPGDQLEAVEGRPVRGLQHRDLAQILRRAGNALRLSITPKQRTDALLTPGTYPAPTFRNQHISCTNIKMPARTQHRHHDAST